MAKGNQKIFNCVIELMIQKACVGVCHGRKIFIVKYFISEKNRFLLNIFHLALACVVWQFSVAMRLLAL